MAVDAAQAELDKAPLGVVRRVPGRRRAPVRRRRRRERRRVAVDGLQPQAQLAARRARRARRRRADAGHRVPRDHPVRGPRRRCGRGRSSCATSSSCRRSWSTPGEVRTLKVKYDRDAVERPRVQRRRGLAPRHGHGGDPSTPSPTRPRVDVDAVRARCPRVERFDGYSDQPFMDFGPRWGCLRSVEYGDGEALVTTVVPDEFVAELDSLWLHPAVLDVATGSAQALIPGFAPGEMFYVPFSYGRVLVRGPGAGRRAVSHVRLRTASAHDLAVFDITIVDGSGRAVIDVEGFTMRRVAVSAALTARRSSEQADRAGRGGVTDRGGDARGHPRPRGRRCARPHPRRRARRRRWSRRRSTSTTGSPRSTPRRTPPVTTSTTRPSRVARSTSGPTSARRTPCRRRRSSASWPRCGASCSASSASGATTTSSSSAASR